MFNNKRLVNQDNLNQSQKNLLIKRKLHKILLKDLPILAHKNNQNLNLNQHSLKLEKEFNIRKIPLLDLLQNHLNLPNHQGLYNQPQNQFNSLQNLYNPLLSQFKPQDLNQLRNHQILHQRKKSA